MTQRDVANYTQLGITTVLTLSLVAGFFMQMIPAEVFLAIAGPIIGYFFSDQKSKEALHLQQESINTMMGVKKDEKEV